MDTVVFTTQEFAVADSADVTHWPGRVNQRTKEVIGQHHLFENEAGDLVFASKVTRNNDLYQLTIQPSPVGPILRVQASLSKIAGSGVNIAAPTPSQIRDALDSIQEDLIEAGVYTDLKEARLSRVDLNRTVLSRRGISDYKHVLRLLDARYMTNSRDFGGEGGFEWTSGRRQVVFYDKVVEMRFRKQDVPPEYENTNLLRFESRFLRPSSVKTLPVSKVSDLYNEDRVMALEKAFNDDLKNRIFRLPEGGMVGQGGVSVFQLIDGINKAREEGGRNYVDSFVRGLGVRVLAENPTQLREALVATGVNKNKKSSLMKEVLGTSLNTTDGGHGGPLRDLYDELRDAFVN